MLAVRTVFGEGSLTFSKSLELRMENPFRKDEEIRIAMYKVM